MNFAQVLDDEKFSLQEYNLAPQIGMDYWHSTLKDQNGIPISSGFGFNKQISRKIAVSEFLERRTYGQIKASSCEIQKKWGLDLLSTGCGFAAGYNLHNTIMRSIGEGIERWVMSKWIDEQFYIEEIDINAISNKLDCPSRWFVRQFESVDFYNKEILVNIFEKYMVFNVTVCIGKVQSGVFLGSGVGLGLNNKNFQHSLLESFRHLLLCKNTKETNKFPDNKVRFFSQNSFSAYEQIKSAKLKKWPNPEVKLINFEERTAESFCIARTIFDGWTCWKRGPIERFLY